MCDEGFFVFFVEKYNFTFFLGSRIRSPVGRTDFRLIVSPIRIAMFIEHLIRLIWEWIVEESQAETELGFSLEERRKLLERLERLRAQGALQNPVDKNKKS